MVSPCSAGMREPGPVALPPPSRPTSAGNPKRKKENQKIVNKSLQKGKHP